MGSPRRRGGVSSLFKALLVSCLEIGGLVPSPDLKGGCYAVC